MLRYFLNNHSALANMTITLREDFSSLGLWSFAAPEEEAGLPSADPGYRPQGAGVARGVRPRSDRGSQVRRCSFSGPF